MKSHLENGKLTAAGLEAYLRSEALRHKTIGSLGEDVFHLAKYLGDLNTLIIRTTNEEHEKIERLVELIRTESKSPIVINLDYSVAPTSLLDSLNLSLSKMKFGTSQFEPDTNSSQIASNSNDPWGVLNTSPPKKNSDASGSAGVPFAYVLLDKTATEAYLNFLKQDGSVQRLVSPTVAVANSHKMLFPAPPTGPDKWPIPDPFFTPQASDPGDPVSVDDSFTPLIVPHIIPQYRADSEEIEMKISIQLMHGKNVYVTQVVNGKDAKVNVTKHDPHKATFDFVTTIPKDHSVLVINLQARTSSDKPEAKEVNDVILITPSLTSDIPTKTPDPPMELIEVPSVN